MCPFCLATLGMVVAGTGSTGGLAATAIKLSRRKDDAGESIANSNERSGLDVNTKLITRKRRQGRWQQAKGETRSTRKSRSQ
jgi:hypothetical protein